MAKSGCWGGVVPPNWLAGSKSAYLLENTYRPIGIARSTNDKQHKKTLNAAARTFDSWVVYVVALTLPAQTINRNAAETNILPGIRGKRNRLPSPLVSGDL